MSDEHPPTGDGQDLVGQALADQHAAAAADHDRVASAWADRAQSVNHARGVSSSWAGATLHHTLANGPGVASAAKWGVITGLVVLAGAYVAASRDRRA